MDNNVKKDIDLLNEQLPKILEGYCNVSKKNREVAEQEAKEFIQIISDSSEYQFGYNHSTGYSMNGYICSKLRYYYPLEFTTSYLNWAENEEDTNNGIELAKIYGIKINSPRFRYSKAEYMCDNETNSIYKGVGSLKFMNNQVADGLYELRNNKYNNFIEVLYDIKKNTSIDARQISSLIKLDYFEEFGKSKKLLSIYELFEKISDKKQISKEKISDLKLKEDLIRKNSKKETEKLFKEMNMKGLLLDTFDILENKSISIKDKLNTEIEYLGYPNTILPKASKNFYFVIDLEIFKNKRSTTYYPTLYNIRTGEKKKFKIKDFIYFAENPFKQGFIIKVLEENKEPKRKLVDGRWTKSTTEFNYLIENWEVL